MACRSLLVGFGDMPPLRVANEAASCPAAPATCDYVSCPAAQLLASCSRFPAGAEQVISCPAECQRIPQRCVSLLLLCICTLSADKLPPVLQTTAYLTSAPNPNVLYGALPAGSNSSDSYVDVRSNANSQVQLDYNAGVAGVMAGLQEAPGSWEQCLQVRCTCLASLCPVHPSAQDTPAGPRIAGRWCT